MKTIHIAGREFRFIGNDIDSAHYLWVMSYLWPCRVEQVVRTAGETDDSYAQRIYARISDHPEFYKLMSGLIVPAALPAAEWSPWTAIDTAKFLSQVSEVKDKIAFTRQAVDAVISFCMLKPVHLRPTLERKGYDEMPAQSSSQEDAL